MGAFTSSPTLQHFLWAAAFIIGFVALSLFLSLASPYFEAALDGVMARMREARDSLWSKVTHFVRDRINALITEQRREPRAPMVTATEDLTVAVEGVGNHQVEALRGIEVKLARSVDVIKSIFAPESQSQDERQKIAESISGTSLFALIFLVLLTFVMGIVNASLLGIFFIEVIGPEPILKYPFPNIPRAYVFAALMFVLEVAAGWAIYDSAKRAERAVGQRSGRVTFFRWVPWFGLLALAIVELAAYALLSQRVDLPHRLGLDPSGPMYGLAEYFLSFLGLGLTLLLAYLGHAIAEVVDERSRAKFARDMVRAVRRGRDTAGQVRELLTSSASIATGLPASLPEEFQRGIGAPIEKESVLATVRRVGLTYAAAIEKASTAEPQSPQSHEPAGGVFVRTPTEVWGDLFVSALFFCVLLTVVVLTALEVLTYLNSVPAPPSAVFRWLAALAAPAAIVGVAVAGWSVLRRLRYATPAASALPERRGRALLGWIVVAALGIAIVSLAALAVAAEPGDVAVFFAFLGVLQGVALCVFAGWIDRGMLALVRLAYIAYLILCRAAALVLVGLATVVSWIAYALKTMLYFLAIPGELIRRRPARASQVTS